MFQKKVLALSLEAFDVYWYTFFAKKGSTHIIYIAEFSKQYHYYHIDPVVKLLGGVDLQ